MLSVKPPCNLTHGVSADFSAMAGIKRPRSDEEMDTPALSPFLSIFETFRDELDEHQARRERIIKASRDITALSKKM
jgi:hypothetical protein